MERICIIAELSRKSFFNGEHTRENSLASDI